MCTNGPSIVNVNEGLEDHWKFHEIEGDAGNIAIYKVEHKNLEIHPT